MLRPFATSRLGSGLGIWRAGDLAARRSGNQTRMKLRCEECGCTTELARGWRAMIVDDEEDPEMDAYVVCYCPSCAQREFGRFKPRHNEQDR